MKPAPQHHSHQPRSPRTDAHHRHRRRRRRLHHSQAATSSPATGTTTTAPPSRDHHAATPHRHHRNSLRAINTAVMTQLPFRKRGPAPAACGPPTLPTPSDINPANLHATNHIHRTAPNATLSPARCGWKRGPATPATRWCRPIRTSSRPAPPHPAAPAGASAEGTDANRPRTASGWIPACSRSGAGRRTGVRALRLQRRRQGAVASGPSPRT